MCVVQSTMGGPMLHLVSMASSVTLLSRDGFHGEDVGSLIQKGLVKSACRS